MLEDYLHNKEIQKKILVFEQRDYFNMMEDEEEGKGKEKKAFCQQWQQQEIWQSSSNTETKLFTHNMYSELVKKRYIQTNTFPTDKVGDM